MGELGRRMMAARTYAGLLSIEEFASRAGMDVTVVRQIEFGVINLGDTDLAAIVCAMG